MSNFHDHPREISRPLLFDIVMVLEAAKQKYGELPRDGVASLDAKYPFVRRVGFTHTKDMVCPKHGIPWIVTLKAENRLFHYCVAKGCIVRASQFIPEAEYMHKTTIQKHQGQE